MKTYTVVGIYKDNKQVFVDFIKAKDMMHAIRAAKDKAESELAVLAVFNGKHMDLYGENELYEE